MKARFAHPERPLAKRQSLLENPRVRSWHAAHSLKSRLSADVDLRKLRLLPEGINLDPESVVEAAEKEPERLQDLLVRYAADLQRRGRVDAYIAKTLSGLKSYLRYRRVRFDSYPELSSITGSTLVNERVPTPEELARILDGLSLRGRVVALTMAHSGVRPPVLGDYTGERGLTLGDLPEMDLRKLKFSEIPFVIRVSATLSKTRVAYTTFGTAQLSSALLSYLAERRAKGEKLRPETPLVAPVPLSAFRGATYEKRTRVAGRRRYLVTTKIVSEVREVLHACAPTGVSWRPYVLRSYCSTRLLRAKGNGRISRDLREAILGHNSGVAARYNVGKRWGPELLSEARREYPRASDYLETTGGPSVGWTKSAF